MSKPLMADWYSTLSMRTWAGINIVLVDSPVPYQQALHAFGTSGALIEGLNNAVKNHIELLDKLEK